MNHLFFSLKDVTEEMMPQEIEWQRESTIIVSWGIGSDHGPWSP